MLVRYEANIFKNCLWKRSFVVKYQLQPGNVTKNEIVHRQFFFNFLTPFTKSFLLEHLSGYFCKWFEVYGSKIIDKYNSDENISSMTVIENLIDFGRHILRLSDLWTMSSKINSFFQKESNRINL